MNTKKSIIFLVLGLVVILVLVFVIFNLPAKVRAPEQSQNTLQPDTNLPTPDKINEPGSQEEIKGLQIEGGDNQNLGGFSVCLDKCGDGICQVQDTNCKNNMNCICPETKADCSRDCK